MVDEGWKVDTAFALTLVKFDDGRTDSLTATLIRFRFELRLLDLFEEKILKVNE